MLTPNPSVTTFEDNNGLKATTYGIINTIAIM